MLAEQVMGEKRTWAIMLGGSRAFCETVDLGFEEVCRIPCKQR
jgi:hypothetical protein